jgi:hypothetical protein
LIIIINNRKYVRYIKDYSKVREEKLDSLGWEITLSVMFESQQSPCRDVLLKGNSFGNLLYDFLITAIPMDRIHRIVEVGGGYGYLMRDF